MNRFTLITGLAIAVLLSFSVRAADQHVMVQADGLKWTDAPPILPKGALIAALYGDPDKAEPFVSVSNSRPATRWQPTCTPTTIT